MRQARQVHGDGVRRVKRGGDWTRIAELAGRDGAPPTFRAEMLDGHAEPVRRYFTAAIAEGTPLHGAVTLEMRGTIRLGRWLPFRAEQILAPQVGTLWKASVAGLMWGSDRYLEGRGAMVWKLLGLIPIVHDRSRNIAQSTAGRAAGESIWAPTATVPPAVHWTSPAHDRLHAEFSIDGVPFALDHRIDDAGLLRESHFKRWGDPDRSGVWRPCTFGVEVPESRSFGPLMIPSRGRAGWLGGNDRFDDGEFFRFEITRCDLVG